MAKQQPFRFKQFDVSQNKCAMKVNTDGVLLGAWYSPEPRRGGGLNTGSPFGGRGGRLFILDIGTGTGVIALMMAQKNPSAKIDAIDIDHDAYLQAKENFEQSPWHNRLTAHHTSLQNFVPSLKPPSGVWGSYDLIISNPPYFIDDFKTTSAAKNVARHSVELSYADLLQGIARLLAANGKAYVVLPAFNFLLFENEATRHHLFVTQLTEVIAVAGKPPYLVLLQLQRHQQSYTPSSITIQYADGSFTDAYKELTKDFYLKS